MSVTISDSACTSISKLMSLVLANYRLKRQPEVGLERPSFTSLFPHINLALSIIEYCLYH